MKRFTLRYHIDSDTYFMPDQVGLSGALRGNMVTDMLGVSPKDIVIDISNKTFDSATRILTAGIERENCHISKIYYAKRPDRLREFVSQWLFNHLSSRGGTAYVRIRHAREP